jgi:hypothetical protein
MASVTRFLTRELWCLTVLTFNVESTCGVYLSFSFDKGSGGEPGWGSGLDCFERDWEP